MSGRPPLQPKDQIHKGIAYFRLYRAAAAVHVRLLPRWPEARIVEYQRGYAVQYVPGSAYYPEREEQGDYV